MKVALCFSGQPRSLEKTFEYWQKNVIEHLRCDVFCHFWKPCGKYLDKWSEQKENEFKWKFDPCLIHSLDAKMLVVEEQINFRDRFRDIKSHAPVQNTFSMLYSIWKSDHLRGRYESDNGLEYDVVIRARTDTLVSEKLILQPIRDNEIYLEFRGTSGDQFAYGSSDCMTTFSSVYWAIPDLLKRHPLHSETFVRWNLEEHGIKIKSLQHFPLMR